MKKLVLLLILLAAMPFKAGCFGDNFNSLENSERSDVVEVSQLEQINAALQNGPVFLRIGTSWCPYCQAMKPILGKMTVEYAGKATIAVIDADKSPELIKYFKVEGIPDSCVIVGIEKGTYFYMQEDGKVSTDRSQARFVGLDEIAGPNEETFKKVLNRAILLRGR
jgi:thiol-disulfide isomerase/thioredoxin